MTDTSASTFECAVAFERLVAGLSATFVRAPAAAVDAHVLQAITRVAEFLDLDRSQVAQIVSGGLQITHQWTRDEAWRVPPFIPEEAVPAVTARAGRGEATVASHLDDMPFETDRKFIARSGTKSVAILPMTIDGRFVGGVTFGSIRREQEWTPEVIGRLQLVVEIIGSALARKAADLELQAALAEN